MTSIPKIYWYDATRSIGYKHYDLRQGWSRKIHMETNMLLDDGSIVKNMMKDTWGVREIKIEATRVVGWQ